MQVQQEQCCLQYWSCYLSANAGLPNCAPASALSTQCQQNSVASTLNGPQDSTDSAPHLKTRGHELASFHESTLEKLAVCITMKAIAVLYQGIGPV